MPDIHDLLLLIGEQTVMIMMLRKELAELKAPASKDTP